MSIEQYLNLVTSAYKNQPKFIAWLAYWLQLVQDLKNFLELINPAFDIDTAEGVQLDITGQRIGQERTVNFTFSDGITSSVLTDELYRIVLKAKIIKNNWKGSIPEIYTMWRNLFPEYLLYIIDNQNMTMDVIYSLVDSQAIEDLVSHGYIVPKPEGVRINYYQATTPIFGFNLNTDTIQGFDNGLWLQSSVTT